MKILKTNPDTGIFNRESYESRRQAFGDNDKKPPILKKWWEILLEALDDATLKILIVAAIVSIIVESIQHPTTGWIEGVAIVCAVAISSGITTVNDYQKQKQFADLNKISEDRKIVSVLREGKLINLH